MKGVSAIISIILLVMITVSLGGLAWVWFFGVTNTLTNAATNETMKATNIMGLKARLEAAKFYPNYVNATIRNTGTVNFDLSKLGVFIDGVLTNTYNPNTGIVTPGATTSINITNATPACPDKILKISFENGFEVYETIDC